MYIERVDPAEPSVAAIMGEVVQAAEVIAAACTSSLILAGAIVAVNALRITNKNNVVE